jgi:hypothetical protein
MITTSLWKYATLLNKIEKEANRVEGEEFPYYSFWSACE